MHGRKCCPSAQKGSQVSSSKEYVEYVLEQLSDAGEVSSRAMMGEYVVYFCDKVIGGIYDDRFLVKPTPAAVSLLAGAEYQIPYEGAKEMLLVDAIENRELMAQLLQAMYPELPERKPRKKK